MAISDLARCRIFVAVLCVAPVVRAHAQSHLRSTGGTSATRGSGGELTFIPNLPRPGQQIAVAYRPSSALAAETHVSLRGCFRTPMTGTYDFVPSVTVAILTRGRDGTFHGSFWLPGSVVFATLSVERVDGSHVDDRRGARWELLTRRHGTLPSYDALNQEVSSRTGRTWEGAYAAARRAAQLYPEDPRSQYILISYEQWLIGEQAWDSVVPQRRARFDRMQRAMAGKPDLSDEMMGTLFWYAWAVGDTVARDDWKGRLSHERPPGPYAIQVRIHYDLSPRSRTDPASALAAYDSLWLEVARVPGALRGQGAQLPQVAFRLAARAGDTSELGKWAERVLQCDPGDSLYVGETLAQDPQLRAAGLRMMRQVIHGAATPDDARRPLTRSRQQQVPWDRSRLAEDLGEYGSVLLRAGDKNAGADTLELAASTWWLPGLARDAAEARLALGDTLRAVLLFARLSVDPTTSDSLRRRIEELASRATTPVQWAADRDTAERQMRRQLMELATDKVLAAQIPLRDSAGVTVTLQELVAGRPAVVVFWSADCGPAVQATPDIQRLATSLAPSHVPVIVISGEPVTKARLQTFTDHGGALPIYYDADRRAQAAFENFGTPSYYVLDARSHIRFTYSAIEVIPSQLAVIER